MERSFLETEIRRICRNKALQSLLILAVLVGVFLFWAPDLSNLYGQLVTDPELREMKTAFLNHKNYIKLEGLRGWDTGWRRTEDGKTKGYYYGVWLPNVTDTTFVIVLSSKAYTDEELDSMTIEGEIAKFAKAHRQIFDDTVTDVAKWNEVTEEVARSWGYDGFVLRRGSDRLFAQLIVAAMALVALWQLWRLCRALMLRGNYREHKQYQKYLDALGGEDSVSALDGEVTAELADKAQIRLKEGNVTVTPNFVVQRTRGGIAVRRVADAAWAYPITTRHYTNGIPTGKTHSIKIAFITGKADEVVMNCRNEKIKNQLMGELVGLLPGALCGYDQAVETDYNKDFPLFVSKVQAMRAQRLAGGGEAARAVAEAGKEETRRDEAAPGTDPGLEI